MNLRVKNEFHNELAQVLVLVTKEFHHQCILRQVPDKDWKVMPSEFNFLNMMKLTHFQVNIFVFTMFQISGLKIQWNWSSIYFHPYMF